MAAKYEFLGRVFTLLLALFLFISLLTFLGYDPSDTTRNQASARPGESSASETGEVGR